MSASYPTHRRIVFPVLLALGIVLMFTSVVILLQSIGYMENAMVGTSLLTALVGFSLLSSSLYVLRLAAYVYATEQGRKE